jgi:ketosteroid isomerase-like protein
MTRSRSFVTGLALAAALGAVASATPAAQDDQRLVAGLDTDYQAAVKRNDAAAMARILDDRFVLVLGDGRTATKADLLDQATHKTIVYEQQDEETGTQTVRLFGDTAVVTAKLWVKGTRAGAAFDRKLWFSDTYVRTPQGWKYVFGQASLALPT